MIALQEGAMSPMFMIIMVIFIIFFMVIPGVKRNRNEKKFKASLEKGIKVVTTGGIHGKLVEINEATVMIETNAGKLLVERTALSMELTKKYNQPAVTTK
ncbi:preprotein translocase subunit YajC [Flavobacteriaceae bacterium]|nr:preprotein translocase subunit YajC [Flavobacteriaceae bacterium]